MKAPPDYKKSVFRHVPTKITVFGKKKTREEIDLERDLNRKAAEEKKRS